MAEYLPTEEDQALWDQYIGPNGVPRITISAPVAEQPIPVEPTEFDNDPFVRAAERLRRRHRQLPVYGPPAPETPPNYLIEPDLLEAQQGQHLPTNMAYNEAGIPFNIQTGAEIPTVRRPNVLPVVSTPEGPRFAMPKVLDVVGNIMGGVAGAPVKAGEVLLGSGAVRKSLDAPWEVKGFEDANWFHGTTHEFDKFKLAKGNPENHLGQYPHFTTAPEDAAANYAGKGPDLTGRIERRAEEILSDRDALDTIGIKVSNDGFKYGSKEYKDAYAKAKEQATKELAGPHEGAVIPAKMKLQNPVSLVDSKPTWLDFNAKYDKDGEWIKDSPNIIKLLNSLKKQGEKYGFDGQKVFDDISEKAALYDGEVKASSLNKALRESDYMLDASNDKGALVSSHVISNVFKDLGFDGIVMDAKAAFPGMKNIPEGTLHAVPLKQNTVKGKYNDKILYSDTRNQAYAAVGHELEKPKPFFSALERAVDNSKVGKASAEQWLGYLKNQPGVKSEEINTVLGDLKGSLTKQEVQDIIKNNKVELKEVVKKNTSPEEQQRYNELSDKINKRTITPEEKVEFKTLVDGMNQPKYEKWQLHGGENYKEMLLTLPERKITKTNYRPYDERGNLLGGPFDKLEDAQAVAKKYKNSRVVPKTFDYAPSDANYKSSHWPDEVNPVAHIRYNDRIIENTPAKQAYDDFEASLRGKYGGEKSSAGGANINTINKATDAEIAKLKELGAKVKNKSFHVEEAQSDLHQAGRDRGYVGEKEKLQPEFDKIEKKLMDTNDEKMLGQPTVKSVLKEAVENKIITQEEANTYKHYTDIENQSPVPDLPFKKNWEELAWKRALHEAAVKGYDSLSWTPGEAQALRYQNDVRTKLDSIDWHNKKMGKPDPDGNKQVLVTPAGSKSEIELTVDKHGEIIKGHPELKGKNLDSVLGKDLAKQVLEKGEGNIDAKGYVMNSEGMKAAYDKRAVDILNNLAKKYGSKVETKHLPEHDEVLKIKRRQLLDDTKPDEEATAKYIKQWDELVADKKAIEAQNNDPNLKASATYKQAGRARINQIESELDKLHSKMVGETVDRLMKDIKGQPIHYLPITPELRAKAKEGFPLFSFTPTTTPVDFDPFKSEDKKFRLIPVSHNPFIGQ